MTEQDGIELVVSKWSAWAPGLEDLSSWTAWAQGAKNIEGTDRANVRFVEPMLRRRLSSVSRMAFRVASDCLEDIRTPTFNVFCSRYGEFARAFELLSTLADEESLSPNTFSLSVHNTSSSLFSIWRNDRSPATALAAGEATLETGFVEAWSALSSDAAKQVLIVYHDEPLPSTYAGQKTDVHTSCALALLLSLPNTAAKGLRLRLAWRAGSSNKPTNSDSPSPALPILRLLLTGGEPIVLETGRLTWIWSRHGAAN